APGDEPAAVAAAKLQEEGISGLPSYIIPPADLMNNHTFHFPKMPGKEIMKILPREIAGAADSSEPMVFNYLNNGPVEDRQVEKMEIAAFYCPKEKMFEFLNHLKDHSIRPAGIIPEAQPLKTLAETNPAFNSQRSGGVFMELMSTRINLNIFKNHYWALERDFLFRVEQGTQGEEDLNEEDFTRISTELNRTFQYFKQKNRGFSIDQAVLYGTSNNLESLKNLINDNHPVTASVIQPEHFGSKVSFPSHLKDSREFISIFTLSIASALAVCGKDYLDVFPTEYKERARLPRRLIGLTIAASLLAAVLTSGTIYFENIKAGYRKDIKKLQRTYSSLSANADIISRTKQTRAEFYTRRYYIDFPLKYSHTSADFIRRLSLISSQEIELISIELNPANQSVTFKLDGRIKAEDNIRAQSRFLRFYQSLKNFDDMIEANSSKVAVNPGKGGEANVNAANPNTPQKEQKEVVLYFTIDGAIDTE
ncbi:MAG: hypothetical protein GY940_20130, partial [bacterium]|nr:hypothetical protein [bacterium]